MSAAEALTARARIGQAGDAGGWWRSYPAIGVVRYLRGRVVVTVAFTAQGTVRRASRTVRGHTPQIKTAHAYPDPAITEAVLAWLLDPDTTTGEDPL